MISAATPQNVKLWAHCATAAHETFMPNRLQPAAKHAARLIALSVYLRADSVTVHDACWRNDVIKKFADEVSELCLPLGVRMAAIRTAAADSSWKFSETKVTGSRRSDCRGDILRLTGCGDG